MFVEGKGDEGLLQYTVEKWRGFDISRRVITPVVSADREKKGTIHS